MSFLVRTDFMYSCGGKVHIAMSAVQYRADFLSFRQFLNNKIAYLLKICWFIFVFLYFCERWTFKSIRIWPYMTKQKQAVSFLCLKALSIQAPYLHSWWRVQVCAQASCLFLTDLCVEMWPKIWICPDLVYTHFNTFLYNFFCRSWFSCEISVRIAMLHQSAEAWPHSAVP